MQSMLKSEVQVWAAHVHTKRALFAAIAQQHNAAVQMADDECGNALACLQVYIVTKSVTKLCCSHAPSIRGLPVLGKAKAASTFKTI